jgi:hypothetical protein
MKKTLTMLVAVTAVAALGLTACGGKYSKAKNEKDCKALDPAGLWQPSTATGAKATDGTCLDPAKAYKDVKNKTDCAKVPNSEWTPAKKDGSDKNGTCAAKPAAKSTAADYTSADTSAKCVALNPKGTWGKVGAATKETCTKPAE